MLKLSYIGIDSWDRPVFQDESGKLWKDINLGDGVPSLHRSVDDEFDGEPDYPLRREYVIIKDRPAESPYKFTYMMLSRLKSNCEYYFGHGDRSKQVVDIDYVLHEMKKLWNELPDDGKPEWLTWEQILKYEALAKPFILKADDHTGDGDRKHFDTYEECVSSMNDDIDRVIAIFQEDKHAWQRLQFDNSAEVYVPNSDIYYEWKIFQYGKESIEEYINHLDREQEKVPQELLNVQFGKMEFVWLPKDIKDNYDTWFLS